LQSWSDLQGSVHLSSGPPQPARQLVQTAAWT